MCLLPEKGLAGIVLAHLAECPVASILYDALGVALGRAPGEKAIVRPACAGGETASDASSYAGCYSSAEGAGVTVEARSDVPGLLGGDGRVPLKPIVERDFYMAEREYEETLVRFIRNESGEVTRLWLSSSSRQLSKERTHE